MSDEITSVGDFRVNEWRLELLFQITYKCMFVGKCGCGCSLFSCFPIHVVAFDYLLEIQFSQTARLLIKWKIAILVNQRPAIKTNVHLITNSITE